MTRMRGRGDLSEEMALWSLGLGGGGRVLIVLTLGFPLLRICNDDTLGPLRVVTDYETNLG